MKNLHKSYKNLLLSLLMFFGLMSNISFGQVSVTASAGTVGPTSYSTLKLAFDAINAGTHRGAINIAISSSTSEGATPAVLNGSVAPANYSSVNIYPTNDAVTISGGATPASRGVIELNGADNVTINGDNPNSSGTNRNLTLTLTGTNANVVLIWMKTVSSSNACTGNSFRNINFRGQTTTNVTTAGILTGSSTFGSAAAAANSNTTIENNNFIRLQNGIFHFGFATSSYDANWLITGNTFGSTVAADKLIFRGMILQNLSGSTISNNIISGVVSTTTSTSNMSGIQFGAASLNCSIFGNSISDIKQMNTVGYGAIGINIGCTTTASNLNIYNNFIWDVAGRGYSTSTVSDNGYGIALTAGGGYNLYYNTVRMNTNQTSATGHPYALLINGVTTASSLNIRNNIFTNETTVGAAGTFYCVYSAAANTVFADINYNDYYYTGTNLGYLGSARANLAAWKIATGKDVQSLAVAPTFVSATDLHLAATSCPLDGKGTPIASFTTDYDAQTRNAATPDIGADEFVATLPTISGTLSICATGTTTLTGSGTAASSNPWTSSNTGVATISGSGTTGTVTGVSAGTTTITYTTNTGCQQTATVTVNALPTISGTLSICNTGTTTLTGSGSAAASNPWTSSNTGVATISGSGTTGTVTGVSAGTTTITYTASTGCQQTATVTVTFTPTCVSSASPTGSGQTALGVTLNWSAVSDATSYDVYFGTDGGGTVTPTNILNGLNQVGTSYSTGALSGLTTYYYQIVPKNSCGSATGCTIYSFTTTSSCTAPTFSATPTNALCFGSSNGSISVSASGGTAPYQYSKDNGITWQSGSSFLGLSAGAYLIVVKGNDGCTALSSSTSVTQPSAVTASVGSATLTGCSGSTVTLSGSASGGTGSYTYSWSPATNLSSSTSQTPTATINGTQAYTLTVTDQNGCVSTNNPTSTVSIGAGITKYWAGAGSGMTGGTAGTDFNTAANWSSTTGTKTAVSSSPQSCDDAVIPLVSAATITLSANVTVNSLNFTTAYNTTTPAILDISTFNFTTIANYSINMTTGAGASSLIEQRIGNGAILTVGGNASIGTGPVTSGFVIIRGSGGAGAVTTGILTFKGNVSMGDGYGTSSASTSTFSKVIFDGVGTQVVSTGATYGFDFQTNYVQIGNINAPTVSLNGPNTWGIYGTSPSLHVKSNSILNLNSNVLTKDLLCANMMCTTNTYTAGGTIILESGSQLRLSGTTGGQTGSNFPLNFTTYTFDIASTVEYYGGTQTVFATPTYGNLTISTTGTKTAGAGLTVAGNMLINSPATFAGSSFTHNFKKNWTNNGTFTAGTSTAIFSGTTSQTIGGSGTNGFYNFTMNNGAGAVLSALASVSNILTLTNGIITTTSTNYLRLTNNLTAAVAGTPSASTHVSGPMRWVLNSLNSYTFPVGKGGNYYPFGLGTMTGTAPEIQVEATNANCGGTADGTTITSISNTEYWQASVVAGTYTTGKVTLGVASIGTWSAIGRNTSTLNGTYSSLGGTVSGNTVTNSNVTGSSLGYFVLAKEAKIYNFTSNSAFTGASTYCKDAPASALTATFNTCTSGTGSSVATTATITWYYNTTNSTNTVGATQVSQTVGVSTGTSSTVSFTYTPSTTFAGTYYYFAVLSSPSSTACGFSTTLTSGTSGTSGTQLVTVNPTSVAGTVSANQTICSGQSPSNITLSGNTGTIQWQVSSDNNTFTDITSATASPLTSAQIGTLTATRYYRAVVTSGVCSSVNSSVVTVTVNALPTVNAGVDQTICAGASATLSGSGATDYTWNNSVSNGVAFAPSATNTYTVTGTDGNGCTNTDQAVVTVNALPTVTASTTASAVCIGGSVTLSGGGANNYTWNNSVSNGVAFAPSATNTYTVTGTNTTTGCTNTASLTVTVNALPTATASANPSSVCTGETITLTGPSSMASYSWSGPSGANFSSSSVQSPTATLSTSGGAFTVTVTDANGCSSSASTAGVTLNSPNVQAINGVIGTNLGQNDYVWKGVTSTDWMTASNWYRHDGTSLVDATSNPGPTDKVFIVSSATTSCISSTNSPVLAGGSTDNTINLNVASGASYTNNGTLNLSGSFVNNGTITNTGTIDVAGSVSLQSGSSLTSNGTIYTASGWTNNGGFNAGTGTVIFDGTAANVPVSGSNTFNNLTVNGGSALVVALQNATTVNGTLTLAAGYINLGSVNLEIGPSGLISGGLPTSFVVTPGSGKLVQHDISVASPAGKRLFPIGSSSSSYTPMSIALASGSTTDDFSAKVSTGVLQDGYSGTAFTSQYVNKTWDIHETTAGGTNASLSFFWNSTGDVLPSFNPNACYITHFLTAGGWDLTSATTAQLSGSQYSVLRNGITSFSPFSVTSTSALPVELTSFQANCSESNTVDVTWSTASEHNTSHFRVDKSRNGTDWDVLGTIGAAGNSQSLIDYALTDYFPNPGINYYRLLQYDMDGTFETFNPQAAVCKEQQAGTTLSTYPNPSSGDFNVDLNTDEMEGKGTLVVTDAKGSVVYSQEVNVINGNNSFLIQRFEGQPGMYYITVKVADKAVTTKHSMR